VGVCAQCQHFRRVKPPSQLLATAYSTSHADVSHALSKIVEDENKQRDEESQYKRSQVTGGKSAWAYKPLMSDFCGLNEAGGEYYIAEVRNAGMQCADFAAGRSARRACADCTHRVAATGAGKDRAQEEVYSRMLVQASSVPQASRSTPEGMLKSQRDAAAARKALEVSGVYASKGVLPSEPWYVDYCGALSTPDEFVICALQNSHHTCAQWNDAGLAPAAIPQASVTATAASPLGESLPAPSPAQLAASAPLASPPEVLIPRLIAALMWILDVQIAPAFADLLQQSMAPDWGKAGLAETPADVERFVLFYEQQVCLLDQESRDAIREQHQPEFVAALRSNTDRSSILLLLLYDKAHMPLAMGDPPLTREVAHCYFDLISLVQALQVGVEWHPLPDDAKQAYTRVLATQYPALDQSQQAWFATLPRGWTSLRSSWKHAPAEERERLRQQILGSFGSLANNLPSTVDTSLPATSYPLPSAAVPQQQPPAPTLATLFGQIQGPVTTMLQVAAPFSPLARLGAQFMSPAGFGGRMAGAVAPGYGMGMGGGAAPGYGMGMGGGAAPALAAGMGGVGGSTSDALLSRIFAADHAQQQQLEKENPEAALQAKLQADSRNAQMLSNMMQMRFQSMMSVANNMRSK
jgi:hypothetical protein